MRTDIYLGIDMGSTGLKAVAFAAGSGATLAAAGGALPYRQLPQGAASWPPTPSPRRWRGPCAAWPASSASGRGISAP
ncbi:hypothetical protein AXXA_27660 [Achromobacter insuavis AXX-A]|uniref:Xylulokinase n=1 Tax=Achromobacter insuavis AXX-A TaxID=1003200 RepID=F7T986_9BURK|nr:hypothetical protein AXXA_27660 [Achromobacter insuavis AXX-A]